MDLFTKLPVSINWKGEIDNLILVIINGHTKMVYYEQMKVSINILVLSKVIIEVVIR